MPSQKPLVTPEFPVNFTPVAFNVPRTCKYLPELNFTSTPFSIVSVAVGETSMLLTMMYGLPAADHVVFELTVPVMSVAFALKTINPSARNGRNNFLFIVSEFLKLFTEIRIKTSTKLQINE